jgi:hypothetical protein
VLGILTLGTIFVPIAAIVAIIGTIIALKNMNIAGIGVNSLAWVLTAIGLYTSPVLLGLLVSTTYVNTAQHSWNTNRSVAQTPSPNRVTVKAEIKELICGMHTSSLDVIYGGKLLSVGVGDAYFISEGRKISDWERRYCGNNMLNGRWIIALGHWESATDFEADEVRIQ